MMSSVPYLHNTKILISLEWDEIWQKGKNHSSSLLKAFQIRLFFNTSIFHFIGTLTTKVCEDRFELLVITLSCVHSAVIIELIVTYRLITFLCEMFTVIMHWFELDCELSLCFVQFLNNYSMSTPWIYNIYSMSPRWIWSDKITNERVARVGYNHFISNNYWLIVGVF